MLRSALERADEATFAALASPLPRPSHRRPDRGHGTHTLSAHSGETAVHARRLQDEAFSTLARLFVLGLPTPVAGGRASLASVDADRLLGLGLERREDGTLWPMVRLVPYGDYYVASDLQPATGEIAPDFVAGIQALSVMLAKLVVRRQAGSALDLGTGCGIQALLAAKHCDRVVATDANGRALEFAEFNARLNGIAGIESRQGDGFDAVAGERFDLVVSNPPYVISPGVMFLYRDNPFPATSSAAGWSRPRPASWQRAGSRSFSSAGWRRSRRQRTRSRSERGSKVAGAMRGSSTTRRRIAYAFRELALTARRREWGRATTSSVSSPPATSSRTSRTTTSSTNASRSSTRVPGRR